MNKCCENCGHCFIDFSVGLYECQNMDNMTEQEKVGAEFALTFFY